MSEYDFREVDPKVASLGMQLFHNLRTLVDNNYRLVDREFFPAVNKAIKSGEVANDITKLLFFPSESDQSEDVQGMLSVAINVGLLVYYHDYPSYYKFNLSQAGARRSLMREHQYNNEEVNKLAKLILEELKP